MKFIDLFAGLGGFHVALKEQGHECVFACEIEEFLRKHYHKNFNLHPSGDISKIAINSIPDHDILCAGFPCQPFSQAGYKKGFKDKELSRVLATGFSCRLQIEHFEKVKIQHPVEVLLRYINNKTK